MSAMPALQLDPAAAYVIVGGLRGLCGSLAVHLARHGARFIISIGRTGIYDAASAPTTPKN
ncbi:polyketide synthase 2 [Penicillium sp. CMV-2018d]|nr:polyketide synthase 2 [Penicillium sp. CMV-2018d]